MKYTLTGDVVMEQIGNPYVAAPPVPRPKLRWNADNTPRTYMLLNAKGGWKTARYEIESVQLVRMVRYTNNGKRSRRDAGFRRWEI